MNLAWPILAARLRGRWRILLAIAVLAGLGLGVSASAVAIARSTDSAYRRIADQQSAIQMEFGYNGSHQDFYDRLEAEPDPALGEVRQWVGFIEVTDPLEVSPDYLAPWRSEAPVERLFVLAGEPAKLENELVVNEVVAEQSEVAVGDSLSLAFMTSDFTEAVPFEFVVAGIGTMAAEFGISDDTFRSPAIFLSRAFGEAHPELVVWSSSGSFLGAPPTRAEATALIQPYDASLESLSIEKEANARAAMRPAVTSLYVLGVLGLSATIALIAFGLSRELEVWTDDRSVLRSLGLRRSRRRLLDAIYATMVTAVTLVVALAVLLVLSRFGPVGELRRFDAAIGFKMDWSVAATTVAGALFATFIAVRLASRAQTAPSVIPLQDLAASLLAGVASSSRRTIGLTMLLGLLAVGAAAATIPYVTSLSTLAAEPERYGQPWTAMARNRWGNQSPDAVTAVLADPAVLAASTVASASVELDGRFLAQGARYEVIKGQDLLTIVRGRTAQGDNEAVIGAATRRELGLQLGDTVTVELLIGVGSVPVFGHAPGPPQEVTLVGDALFPALSVPGGAVPRLDQGIMVQPAVWAVISGTDDLPEVTLLSTESTEAAVRLADAFPQIEDLGVNGSRTEWFIGAKPAEIRNIEGARDVMIFGTVALSAVVAGVLGLALRTILAGQQRDLAVLRALGASRRQLRHIAWKQGLLLLVPMTLLGVPIGIAAGRLMYSRLAKSIGVVSKPETPWWAVAAFLLAMAVTCAISVAMSSRVTSRIAPATSLRAP